MAAVAGCDRALLAEAEVDFGVQRAALGMPEEKVNSHSSGGRRASNVTSDWLTFAPVQRVTYSFTLSQRDDVFQFG